MYLNLFFKPFLIFAEWLLNAIIQKIDLLAFLTCVIISLFSYVLIKRTNSREQKNKERGRHLIIQLILTYLDTLDGYQKEHLLKRIIRITAHFELFEELEELFHEIKLIIKGEEIQKLLELKTLLKVCIHEI